VAFFLALLDAILDASKMDGAQQQLPILLPVFYRAWASPK